ncbi:PaaI family thioesterase [Hyphomonas sp.]|uniref:PaaI family thioesterase n=1 Tax=Hyphomonas sp. TaxID=87 RepID=UPI0032EE88BF|tara:strand:- start:8293 stop:8781 length:489 start_codon:yes stop_codon:yes gene_type:complete
MSDDATSAPVPLELMQGNLDMISGVIPWGRRLGFRMTKVEKGHVWGLQPWKDRLVGDPDTGVIHGGVLTAFLDNLCGTAASSTMERARFVATLDLRIDYMRPADPRRDILGEAECYHVTRSICFTRAWAYHETRDKVIATAAGAFAITKPRPPSTMGGQDDA